MVVCVVWHAEAGREAVQRGRAVGRVKGGVKRQKCCVLHAGGVGGGGCWCEGKGSQVRVCR